MATIPTNASSGAAARKVRAVTPHASNDLTDGPCRALYIGVGGDVSLIASGDTSAVTFKNAASGSTIAVGVKAVRVSGTTATDIVALY